jgi:uncharacterized membrane protein
MEAAWLAGERLGYREGLYLGFVLGMLTAGAFAAVCVWLAVRS